MADRLPLPALLSQVLVAFIIEFDNEFEHQSPHRTTVGRAAGPPSQGPWLASMAMWSTCMRFVDDEGLTVRQIEDRARTKTNWNGMERWGYIVIGPDSVVRATTKGRQAREVWASLFPVIEDRWRERFGASDMDGLVDLLRAVGDQVAGDLPECMPILGYGLWSTPHKPHRSATAQPRAETSNLTLAALLSRVLLAFAIEFEQESKLSLAISANVVRVLNAEGARLRDIPILSGVSKESISVAMGILTKDGLATTATGGADGRTKIVRLTAQGLDSQATYHRRIAAIEDRWRTRFGVDQMEALRQSLERFVGDATPEGSPLFLGLTPYPDGWRASVRPPRTLPHYPMVLHRGGYPDGS